MTRSTKIRNKLETLSLASPLQTVILAAMADFQVLMFLISLTTLDCCHPILMSGLKKIMVFIKKINLNQIFLFKSDLLDFFYLIFLKSGI